VDDQKSTEKNTTDQTDAPAYELKDGIIKAQEIEKPKTEPVKVEPEVKPEPKVFEAIMPETDEPAEVEPKKVEEITKTEETEKEVKEEVKPEPQVTPEPVEKIEEKEEIVEPKSPEPIAAKPSIEDPRITEKDRSIKHIFGQTNDDNFYPLAKKEIKKEDSQIEVQQYDAPKATETQDKPTQSSDQPKPVINSFDQINTNRAIATSAIFAVLVLFVGFGGGFFGYKYVPSLIKKQAASADTITSTSTDEALDSSLDAPITPEVTPTTSVDPATKDWTSYTNTKYKYSIKIPANWFSLSSNTNLSDIAEFDSVKPTTSSPAGAKVEISFYNANSKLIKDWITENNKVLGYGEPKLTTTKIDGKDAYQQTVTTNGKTINTYVFQSDKIMAITYSAPVKDFDAGKTIYQNMLNSIKLL